MVGSSGGRRGGGDRERLGSAWTRDAAGRAFHARDGLRGRAPRARHRPAPRLRVPLRAARGAAGEQPRAQAGGLERGERVVVRATRLRLSARVERPHDTQAADRVRVGTGGRRRVASCCVPRAGGQHRRGRGGLGLDRRPHARAARAGFDGAAAAGHGLVVAAGRVARERGGWGLRDIVGERSRRFEPVDRARPGAHARARRRPDRLGAAPAPALPDLALARRRRMDRGARRATEQRRSRPDRFARERGAPRAAERAARSGRHRRARDHGRALRVVADARGVLREPRRREPAWQLAASLLRGAVPVGGGGR